MYSIKRILGNKGEEIAVTFLMKHGFTVVGRNYLKRYGEIDIIARKAGNIHFIEVKTVTRDFLGNNAFRAEDNLHKAKILRLSRTIEIYLSEKGLTESYWQLDAVIVILNKRGEVLTIEYLENLY